MCMNKGAMFFLWGVLLGGVSVGFAMEENKLTVIEKAPVISLRARAISPQNKNDKEVLDRLASKGVDCPKEEGIIDEQEEECCCPSLERCLKLTTTEDCRAVWLANTLFMLNVAFTVGAL